MVNEDEEHQSFTENFQGFSQTFPCFFEAYTSFSHYRCATQQNLVHFATLIFLVSFLYSTYIPII